MMKIICITAVLILCSTAIQAQDVLLLEDAVSLGLENNHRIRIARNSAEIAENNTTRGSANFLPTLDATGSYSFTRTEQETNSPFSFGNSDTRNAAAQLALNWTIFDGFRMFVENDRYRALARLGQSQARNTVELTVVRIVAAYKAAVQQARLVDVLSRTLDISRTRFEKESVRRELGGSATDYLNAQIAYNSDSSALLSQQLEYLIARQELNLLLGRDPATPFDVVRDIDLPAAPDEYAGIIDKARMRNADLSVLRENLRVTQASVGASRSSFLPRIGLFATYGYSDRLTGTDDTERFASDISTQSTDAAVGLSFSFNLFNGFRNSTDVQNSVLERRSAETAVEEAEYLLQARVREQLETLETRLLAVRLDRGSLDAAEKNLALQLERYDIGSVTSLEFRDAQLQYVRAETTHILARFQAHIASLELQRLVGEIRIAQ
jgi:outer membrane protein TolC